MQTTITRTQIDPKKFPNPLREKADSLAAAHALLDEWGFPRVTPVGSLPMTIYGRLVQLLPHKSPQRSRCENSETTQ